MCMTTGGYIGEIEGGEEPSNPFGGCWILNAEDVANLEKAFERYER